MRPSSYSNEIRRSISITKWLAISSESNMVWVSLLCLHVNKSRLAFIDRLTVNQRHLLDNCLVLFLMKYCFCSCVQCNSFISNDFCFGFSIFSVGFCLFLEHKSDIGICPTKCVWLLLKRLFFGVTLTESKEENANTFSSKVCVSYEFNFTSPAQRSQALARNVACAKALRSLCDVENKFVQRKEKPTFPSNFASKVQE